MSPDEFSAKNLLDPSRSTAKSKKKTTPAKRPRRGGGVNVASTAELLCAASTYNTYIFILVRAVGHDKWETKRERQVSEWSKRKPNVIRRSCYLLELPPDDESFTAMNLKNIGSIETLAGELETEETCPKTIVVGCKADGTVLVAIEQGFRTPGRRGQPQLRLDFVARKLYEVLPKEYKGMIVDRGPATAFRVLAGEILWPPIDAKPVVWRPPRSLGDRASLGHLGSLGDMLQRIHNGKRDQRANRPIVVPEFLEAWGDAALASNGSYEAYVEGLGAEELPANQQLPALLCFFSTFFSPPASPEPMPRGDDAVLQTGVESSGGRPPTKRRCCRGG